MEDYELEGYEEEYSLQRVERIGSKKRSKNKQGRHYIKTRQREQEETGLVNFTTSLNKLESNLD